jgi:NAD(P)-dependent dehydrogenase (short-subunit alcohol dehydrogenase family)
MSVDLAGQSALVTGAGTGIGRGIALKLAQYGARVAVHYSSSVDGAQETAQLIQSMGGRAIIVRADLARTPEGIVMVEQVIDEFGRLDILVNNAAVSTEKNFFDVTEEIWDQTLDLNLKSSYFCAQSAARQMSRQGGGKIIFIGSIHGTLTSTTFGPYAASKGGINMITRQLALELAPLKINVNCVAPGVIEVERYYKQFPWYNREETARNVPWGRVGFPEDVANLVAVLASDEADFITGQIIYVDGGQTAKLALYRPDLQEAEQ